jgi:DNA-directed RNA polymerase specialized sigma subunit
MTSLKPVIRSESGKWRQTGINPNILESHAEELAYDALHTYNPEKSQLNTHVTNHLQKMNRFVIKNQQAVRAQETAIFDYRKYNRAQEELAHELGRDPTDAELKKHLGPGVKVGEFKPTIEHYYSMNVDQGGKAPVREELNMESTALGLMYDSLDPQQKSLFEQAYGYNPNTNSFHKELVTPKKDIAAQRNISPAAISKQLRKIEQIHHDHVRAAESMSKFGSTGLVWFRHMFGKTAAAPQTLQKITWSRQAPQHQNLNAPDNNPPASRS